MIHELIRVEHAHPAETWYRKTVAFGLSEVLRRVGLSDTEASAIRDNIADMGKVANADRDRGGMIPTARRWRWGGGGERERDMMINF